MFVHSRVVSQKYNLTIKYYFFAGDRDRITDAFSYVVRDTFYNQVTCTFPAENVKYSEYRFKNKIVISITIVYLGR